MKRWIWMAARWIGVAALGGLWLAGRPSAQETAGFLVVVNAANETTALERSRISKMFLKKIKSWPDSDVSVTPIDRNEKSPIREAFTRAIHGKKVAAIKSYWQRMIFSGRDVPPPEVGSDQEVLDHVEENPGAIGYVSPAAELVDGVRELEIAE